MRIWKHLVWIFALPLPMMGQASSVLTPGKRQEVLDQARQFLVEKKADVPADAPNPFQREAEAAAPVVPSGVQVQPAGPRSDREKLAAIAEGIVPTGIVKIGGEPTLIFGQKKVKAGNFLTITFEGNEYTLQITAIDRTSFTLRLNNEEYTRPIK